MVALLGQLFFEMHGIISYIRPMKNRKWLLLPFFFLHAHFVAAQLNAYQRSIQEHRQAYKKEFLTDENSPLKKEDTAFLRFFEPHSGYIVPAQFEKIEDKTGFDMQTHNGVIKKYFIYGFVSVIAMAAMHHYVRLVIVVVKNFLQQLLPVILMLWFVGINVNRSPYFRAYDDITARINYAPHRICK